MKGSRGTKSRFSGSSILSDITPRIYDEKAMTVREIAEYTGESIFHARSLAKGYLESGRWERVWKKIPGQRPVEAYRKVVK